MPSSSPKQARFMRAIDHGWVPDRVKAPPRSVAREFVQADKEKGRRARGRGIGTAIGKAIDKGHK